MTESSRDLILYSESEEGFWSNEQGWVKDAESATRFSREEAGEVIKPVAKFVEWIKYDARYVIDEGDVLIQLTDEEAVESARAEHHRDGEVEIDQYVDPAQQTSRGDDRGCYVKAWVWVPWPEVTPEPVKL